MKRPTSPEVLSRTRLSTRRTSTGVACVTSSGGSERGAGGVLRVEARAGVGPARTVAAAITPASPSTTARPVGWCTVAPHI